MIRTDSIGAIMFWVAVLALAITVAVELLTAALEKWIEKRRARRWKARILSGGVESRHATGKKAIGTKREEVPIPALHSESSASPAQNTSTNEDWFEARTQIKPPKQ